jgi:hypothetical protein
MITLASKFWSRSCFNLNKLLQKEKAKQNTTKYVPRMRTKKKPKEINEELPGKSMAVQYFGYVRVLTNLCGEKPHPPIQLK